MQQPGGPGCQKVARRYDPFEDLLQRADEDDYLAGEGVLVGRFPWFVEYYTS